MKRQMTALGIASIFFLLLTAVQVTQFEKPFVSGSVSNEPKQQTPTAALSHRGPSLATREAARYKVVESYGRLPLSFEANRGQADPRVKFLSRGNGSTLFLTSTEAVLALRSGRAAKLPDGSRRSLVLRTKLVGANPAARIAGFDPSPGRSNYFTGKNPANWHTEIPHFAKVKYEGIYPGVDLVYYGNQRHLEYDFVVAPGADPRCIEMAVDGAEKVYVDTEGDLMLRAAGQEVRWRKPVIYQNLASGRREISGSYVEKANHIIGFAVGPYDASYPLVIDPVLSYSTYLGGTGPDFGSSIAVDSAGNIYVTGETLSSDFPTTAGSLQPANGDKGGPDDDANDAFVVKLNSAGSALVYSTYLGGRFGDSGQGIAVDSGGNAYVTGFTGSTDFPTVNPLQAAHGGQLDAFVAKLNPAGSGLMYSTYLGGGGEDLSDGIAVDSPGNVYVIGRTLSANFPTANALQSTSGGGTCGDHPCADAFVVKLNPTGSAFGYSTYLGGNSYDDGTAIAVDASGNVYITGATASTNFPLVSSFQAIYGGDTDAFVAKLNPAGATLLYSTYLGGAGGEAAGGIAVDSSGNTYVTGVTGSTNFPTASPFQSSSGGSDDAFVAKMNPTGLALVYSTYLGGGDNESASEIAVDGAGNAYVTGFTASSNFPTASPLQGALGGGTCTHGEFNVPCVDTFVAKLNPMGAALVYSTYLGGNGDDWSNGIAVDSTGNVYLTGTSQSPNFPTVNPLKPMLGSGLCTTSIGVFSTCSDAFVAKISSSNGPSLALGPASLAFAGQAPGTTSAPQTVTLTDAGSASLTIANIAVSGDFAQISNCPISPATLGAGASCAVNVTFAPTATGVRTGSVTITSDVPGSPHVVSLTGTGGLPDFSLSAPSGTSATVAAGQTATYGLSLVGSNGFNGMVSFTCSDNAPATACSVSPGSVMVSGTNPATATVSVTTTAPHAFVPPNPQLPTPPSLPSLPVTMLWLLVALTLTMMLGSRQSKAQSRRPAWAALACIVLLATLAVGCGGASPPPPAPTTQTLGTPSGTYQVTVTATSGGTSHSMNLTMTVQ